MPPCAAVWVRSVWVRRCWCGRCVCGTHSHSRQVEILLAKAFSADGALAWRTAMPITVDDLVSQLKTQSIFEWQR